MERDKVLAALAALILEDSQKVEMSPYYEPYRYIGEQILSEAIEKNIDMNQFALYNREMKNIQVSS